MRIETLEIEAFKKFDRRMRLEGLGAGLNVLCEPNEFGKSTLLAAIKTVIFEQYRSKAKGVQECKHVRNDTSPMVSLGFCLDGAQHHIEKRFLHREHYARLVLPDGTRLENDAAEERLQALLGFAPPGKQGANKDTIGLWGALWCKQQAACEQPDLPQTGRATLHACLEAELGTLAGDDRSTAIRGQVEAALAQLLDGNRKPRGRYKEVLAETQEMAAALETLSGKRRELEETIEALARLRQVLARASDADEAAKLAHDLAQAREQRDQAMAHAGRLRQAVTDLALATQRRQDAQAETERRVLRARTLVEAEAAVTRCQAARTKTEHALAEATALVSAGRTTLDSAQTEADATAAARRGADALAALVAGSANAQRLGGQLARAEAAQTRINQLAGALAAQPADQARLEAAQKASVALDRAVAGLEAQATELAFDLLPGVTEVRADGKPVPPGQTRLRITAETTVTLPGIGRLQVRPMIRDHAKLQSALSAAQAMLQAALAAIGAADLDQAHRLAAARRATETDAREARATLDAAAPGEAGLEPGVEALRNHVAAEQSRVAAELVRLGVAALPAATEATEAARVASLAEGGAADRLARARAEFAGLQAEHGRATSAELAAAAALAEAIRDRERLGREDAAAVAQESAAALATRLSDAALAEAACTASVAQLQHAAPAQTLEWLEARIRRFEDATRQQARTAETLRVDIARHEERVAREEGEGLDEAIAAAGRRAEDLGLERAALAREVDVLTLLRDTLAAAEQEARARYRAPVMRRMTPYLRGLFPDVEVALDDDLRVTSLTRRAECEDVARLSDGTREQVAVLLRLAYAELLRERGKPAMLILDDALAYTDPDRRELMFDLLTRAAETMQILILTCRSDAVSRLGGNRVALVPV